MSEIKVDTVAEKTSANGVTVDGLNIKDSKLVTANSVITSNITDANITTAKIADVNVTEGKIADNAITLAKMASGTDGNIISYDASGNPVAVATGSAGQVLTSAGAGAPPTFAAASSDFVKIATVTAGGSSNVVSFDGHFSSTYDKYKIYIQNWRGNDNSHITMRYRIGNSEKSSSHYTSVQEGFYRNSSGSSNDNNSVWNGSAMRITPNGADDSANYFQHCVIDLINPLGTGYKTCTFETSLNAYDQTLFIHGIGGGHYYGDTGALSGLSFYISAGTITATIKIYGIKT